MCPYRVKTSLNLKSFCKLQLLTLQSANALEPLIPAGCAPTALLSIF